MKLKIHQFEVFEIEQDIREIERLIAAEVLGNPDVPTAEKNADFTWLMINLRDLLAKTEKFSSRVAFSDDVIPMWLGKKAEVSDITGLVKCFRDAMCHRDSFRNLVGTNAAISLGTITYGAFVAIKLGDFATPKCDYPDDLMFFCGPQRIYFRRHIVRSFETAKERILPIIENRSNFNFQDGTWEIEGPPSETAH